MTDTTPTVTDAGMTPGRKIKAFLWMNVSLIVAAFVMTKIGTPEHLSVPITYAIAIGGYFVIGGQTLIDSLGKLRLPGMSVGMAPVPIQSPTPNDVPR
jgi:hypothetical protein